MLSILDLKLEFWQVKLRSEDKAKTAFSTSRGRYEFVRMAQDLSGSPATYQKLMSDVCSIHHLQEFAVPFMDDVLVYSKDWTTHLQHIDQVLAAFEHSCLRDGPEKCKFMKR